MKKAIYLYNPFSGDRIIQHMLDYILERFQQANVLLQPYRFLNSDAGKLQDILTENEFDYAVISGGDGTLNSAVNTLLRYAPGLPTGIIPSGTCNDLAGSLNLPSSLKDCIDVILAGKTLEIDVGLINNEKYFLSSCAGGVFVDVSFSTNNELKKNFGPFAYYLKALSELVNVKSFNIKIETESEKIEENVLIFLVLNGKRAAGFPNLLNEADISDGMMDIVLIKNCLHIDLAGMFFKVLASGSLKDKNVITLKAKTCTIKGSRNISLSVDGDKGPQLPVDVSFVNKALKVFV